MFQTDSSLVQNISISPSVQAQTIWVKRDDLIDPVVSGNKWRKLKYAFLKANDLQSKQILTFGGAYSNHLLATAKACQLANFQSIGIVRGDELNARSNAILEQCEAWGMKLHFVSRNEYTLRNDTNYLNELHQKYPSTFIIPEGGASYYGMLGCQEIWGELLDYTVENIFLAAGTGTTSAGLLMGIPKGCHLYAVSVLAGEFMAENIRRLLYQAFFDWDLVEEKMQQLTVLEEYHFGKYGKKTPGLIDFIAQQNQSHQLNLDSVYTGKAFYALHEELKKKDLSNVLFLHTGGLGQ